MHRTFRLVVVGLALGLLTSSASPRLRAQEAPLFSVAGTVVDAVSKAPVSGARVAIYRGTAQSGSAVTGEDGRFEIAGLPAGRYELGASHDDYVPLSAVAAEAAARHIELGAIQTVSGVVLRLSRRPIISGIVRDERGEPIVDADVIAFRWPGTGALERDRTGRTDDRGAYRLMLSGLAREYVILVPRDGQTELKPGVTRADLRLTYPSTFYPNATRSADATPVVIAPNEERVGVDVTLTPRNGVSVRGQFTAGGAAWGLVDLYLLRVDAGIVNWDLPVGIARIPPGIRFSFSNVPPGDYLLWAVSFPRHTGKPTPTFRRAGSGFSGSGFVIGGDRSMGPPPDGDTLWVKAPVTVEADDVEVTAAFGRGPRLRGRVVFDGVAAPLSNVVAAVPVWVMAADGALLGSVPIGGVETDGRFRTVGLPPGAYELIPLLAMPSWHLRSVAAGGRDITGQPIDLGTDDVVDLVYTFTDRKTSITGVLRDEAGRPLDGGMVTAFPVDRSGWNASLVWSSMTSARSGAGGAFDLVVRPGREYFVASVPRALEDRLRDADKLEALSRTATRVRMTEGEQVTLSLVRPAVP